LKIAKSFLEIISVAMRGNAVNRDEAIALLKEIAQNKNFSVKWISLVNGKPGYEIHVKPMDGNPASLEPIFEKRGLKLKEVKDTLVIYREHNEPQG
jgi:hypothetical protein